MTSQRETRQRRGVLGARMCWPHRRAYLIECLEAVVFGAPNVSLAVLHATDCENCARRRGDT